MKYGTKMNNPGYAGHAFATLRAMRDLPNWINITKIILAFYQLQDRGKILPKKLEE